jgi:dipeptidyl aminopeptidase/acylaminoacyl peptidase
MPAPITAAMVARSGAVADPRWSPAGDRLAWVDVRAGRADVVVASSDAPPVVVTAERGVGGGFAWASDDELVVAAADGRLVVVGAAGGEHRVLTRDGRALAPAVSRRGEVACCIERDDACDVAVVPLDGSQWPRRMSRADYAWDPAWSPDGSALAWHEWDLPDMPWDASRVVVADADAAKVVAGGDGVGVGQPRFSPSGDRLAFVCDAEGFMQVWTARPDGSEAAPALREPREHAEPAWSAGQRSFAWSPDGAHLAWTRNEDGFGRLVVAAPGSRSARELSRGWHRGLDWGAGGIACVRSGAVTAPAVVTLAANGSGRRAWARGPAGGFEPGTLVEPRAVSWRSGGADVHGLLYRPRGVERPPLVVHVHGGPTGQALADWNARVQWLVGRGWAVLQPNHRGSSGYGRAYAQALASRWGERDVDDVVHGLRHAVKEGWCDPARVVLMGGSAGGFTALLVAAAHPELVQAVVALYPVVDLLHLAATTHRFESGYHLRLVGPLPERRDVYRDRSPSTVAARIRAPVLLLHGSDDRSVPAEQSAALADALRAHGAPVERHVYEGEGHGWRRPETVADELARVEEFLARWVP